MKHTLTLCIAALLLAWAKTRAASEVLPVSTLNAIHWSDDETARWKPYAADLAPAKWIWFPVERTLPNTFALFRKTITLDSVPKSARGWIAADSRYRLTVNGRCVQWGPAPSDPRTMDLDPWERAAAWGRATYR